MRIAVITGANRGIGRALAEKFLQSSYFVIGTSREGIADFSHGNLLMLPLDLADAESRAACARKIIARAQSIDVLINNAGIFDERDEGPLVNIEALRATLEVNLIGTIDFTERVVSVLAGGGHLVNVSSRRGSCGYTKDTLYPGYSISKAGLNLYTRKLAARLGDQVTVSCVHPGQVKTDMNPEGTEDPVDAAEAIYQIIETRVPTGHFWNHGEEFPW